jgi:hypothetical protein
MNTEIYYVRQYELNNQGKLTSQETVCNEDGKECGYATYQEAVNDILSRVYKKHILESQLIPFFEDIEEEWKEYAPKYKAIHEGNLIHLFFRNNGWAEFSGSLSADFIFRNLKNCTNPAYWTIHMLELPPVIANKLKLLG